MADDEKTITPEERAAGVVGFTPEGGRLIDAGRVVMRPTPHLLLKFIHYLIGKLQPKSRRKSVVGPIQAVRDEVFGPNWPPETLSTARAIRALDNECKARALPASDDSLRRAIDRR